MPASPTVEELWRPVLDAAARDDPSGRATRVGATFRGAATIAPAAASAPPAAPVTEASFVVRGEVGRGGMAVVYRARQQALGRMVALKAANEERRAEAFLGEALVTASLEHPNIVPVHDLVRVDGRLALVMKLVAGSTWDSALDEAHRAGALDLDAHLDVLLAVSNAVAFAHANGIVHLDVKPENVLIGAFGEVLVVDWGIALSFRDAGDPVAPPRASLRSPCGTPAYLAPELALADVAAIGPATDVYLLGATLFHVVTGRAPRDHLPVMDALVHAASEDRVPWRDGDRAPPGLRAVIERAMARDPAARYPDVAAFQAAVRDFRRHRESVALSDAAALRLAAITPDDPDRARLYTAFAEVVAAFGQALVAWPDNPDARRGERAARLAFAEAALANGDLALAETHAAAVAAADPPDADRARALLARVAPAARARARAHRLGLTLRWTVGVAVVVIVVGLALGTWLVAGERDRAHAQQAIAEQRLGEILRLADVKRLDDLEGAADRLWPALPATEPALARWLADAEGPLARLPSHREALAAMRAQGRRDGDAWRFDTMALQWEHDTLAELVAGLERLAATRVPDVERRLADARTIAARSIDAHREAWEEARRTVLGDPRYAGLDLPPQIGLVPLGPDPITGLQELAHLSSGTVPARGPDGRLALDEASGIVLVLVPGGAFDMGARPPDDAHPPGTPNVDPDARPYEGPVRRVTLAPYLIGKHEVTQAQWLRVAGANPSAYVPGRVIGGRTVTASHPVELVGHGEAAAMLGRWALVLPTEAQWEYAARAGTSTPFWTGATKESLVGALNIADAYCRDHEGPGSWSYEGWLDDGYTTHAPIGSYRPNAFGLHDTSGNVWEWCADHVAPYDVEPRPGDGLRVPPPGPVEAPFVFRGGGFRANLSHARVADRYLVSGLDHRSFDIGVRVARALDPRQNAAPTPSPAVKSDL